MITININHAFDGFLYAPLFLASELGFFPKCARLVFRGGDSECLDALCEHTNGNEKNWFAICDPFSVDIATKVPANSDQIAIVGCLVDKLPCWVYNPDPSIPRVDKEESLGRYSDKIQKLVCYKETTTGYLLGKRLQTVFKLKDADIETVPFGEEFNGTVENSTVIVTSDVLRVVQTGLAGHNLIFNYPKRSPDELKPFLFTGILTLKNQVVDDNLWAALTLLAGLKHAADLLREKTIRPEVATILTTHFAPKLTAMGVTDRDEQEKLIREAIVYAFQTEDLYADSLKPEKSAWDNAQKQWETITKRTFVETEERNEPIPALLIKGNWRHDAELRTHLNAGIASPTSVVRLLKLKHKVAMIAIVPMLLLCLFVLLDTMAKAKAPMRDNFAFITVSIVALAVMTAYSVALFRELYKGVTTHFGEYIGTILSTAFATLLSAIAFIK